MIAKSLFQWEMPNLPEDLSFFKQGKVWLATSSDENNASFSLRMKPKLQKLWVLKV